MSEGEKKKRDPIDYLQWLFTLLIALGGLYLDYQQGGHAHDLKEAPDMRDDNKYAASKIVSIARQTDGARFPVI